MELVEPGLEWKTAFLDLARDWRSVGGSRYDLAIENFDAYLERSTARRHGLKGKVPQLEYWLEDAGLLVGCVRVRLVLTEDLEQDGGHIGYDVRPSMRRRGYGSELLRLGLSLLCCRGIHRVRITCDDDNMASWKVIEKHSGVLSGVTESIKTGKQIRQYWVDCASIISRDSTMYEIRSPVTADDWDTYHTIREQVLWIARGRIGVYDRDYPDEYAQGHFPLLLMCHERPVAVARVDVDGEIAWLRRVAVASDVQRQGHGRTLLSSVERFAVEKGCRTIRSKVDSGAVEFYVKNGYRRTGDSTEGGNVLMEKTL